MNWVLSHIILSLSNILNNLSQKKIRIHAELNHYKRRSLKNLNSQELTPFKQLKTEFSTVHDRLLSVLNNIPPEKFTEIIRKDKSLADDLAFLYFHEAYHAGQIGLI